MKVRNTSRFADRFVRRMLRWCIAQLDIPRPVNQRDAIKEAWFRDRRSLYSGHCYGNRIVVSISGNGFPTASSWCRAYTPATGGDVWLYDSIEALVMVTAHELGHVQDRRLGHFGRGSEARADAAARCVLRLFRESKDDLVQQWMAGGAATVTVSLAEVRERKAVASLARWQRKLKIAQGRVRKYTKRVRYYHKQKAAP